MSPRDRTAEQVAGALASRAHGVVTRVRLRRAGLTDDDIKRLVRRGVLIRVHRGVYRVGHLAPSDPARYLAAVLACGEAALLGGSAAAHLLEIVARPPRVVGVWTPTERRVRGVRTRRARGMGAWERWTWRQVPVVSPARALVDLAEFLSVDALAHACHRAQTIHRITPAGVAKVTPPNAPGAKNLRHALEGAPVSLSRLESRFLRRLRDARLPLPDRTNRREGSFVVDCRWTRYRLTVELDSYRFHNNRFSWERDQRRAREAYARGDEFRRYTWGDVFEAPEPMLAELRLLLTRQS